MAKKKKKKKPSKQSQEAPKPAEESAADGSADELTAADDEDQDADQGDDDDDIEPIPESIPASVPPPVPPPPPPASDHGDEHHHAPDRREYWKIFFVLGFLTLVEVLVPTYLEHAMSKGTLVSVLVALALAKAGIVALFYMHLKHETKIMKWTVAFPVVFPAIYAFVLIAEGIWRAIRGVWWGNLG